MENRFFAKKFYVAYMSYELFLEELREQSATSNYKKIIFRIYSIFNLS